MFNLAKELWQEVVTETTQWIDKYCAISKSQELERRMPNEPYA